MVGRHVHVLERRPREGRGAMIRKPGLERRALVRVAVSRDHGVDHRNKRDGAAELQDRRERAVVRVNLGRWRDRRRRAPGPGCGCRLRFSP